MPRATTSATAEWLPRGVRAGRAHRASDRERSLADVRRITQGWDAEPLAFTHDGRSLVVVGRRSGEAARSVATIDLVTGESSVLASDLGDATTVSASVSERSTTLLFVHSSPAPARAEEAKLGPRGLEERRALSVGGATIRAATTYEGRVVALERATGATTSLRLGTALLGDEMRDAPFAVSRDEVAFVRQGALWMSSSEGRGVRRAFDGLGEGAVTSLDDQGVALLTSNHEVERSEVYAVHTRASPPTIERLSYEGASSAVASREGRYLAFASRRAGPSRDVFVARWLRPADAEILRAERGGPAR